MNRQDALFNLLTSSLEEELRVHQALHDVVVHEKEALIVSNLEELTESNKTKDAILLKLKKLGEQRSRAAFELSGVLGFGTQPATLKEMAVRLSPSSGEKLRLLHESFEIVVGRIQDQNAENSALIQSALMNVQGALKSIKGTLTENKTYQRKGAIEEKTNSGQLVSKEA